jgi:hypothetical protein
VDIGQRSTYRRLHEWFSLHCDKWNDCQHALGVWELCMAVDQVNAQGALAAWVDKRFTELSRGRWAEEREWFESGMFYQMKQWLESDENNKKKLVPIKKSAEKKFPMPVSDHFSKTINTNAGFLGSALPRMQAMADNYDSKNRRAGQAAENAIDAANQESGMNVLNPQLAKRVMLFGLGVTKDTVAFDHSSDEVPEETQQGVEPVNIPTPRLDTELPMIFNVYLPRDCKDPNLAPLIIERIRKPIGAWKELYPDTEFTKDDGKSEADESLAFYYVESLRSLSMITQPQEDNNVTLTEAWFDWSELGEEEQDAVEAEWAETPSQMYPGMTRVEAAVQYGLYAVVWKGQIVDSGENPWGDDKDGHSVTPYTFFAYEKDPASVYNKALAATLKPLQKQLNRYKSLVERAMLTNGSTRILWPNTQNGQLPTGDPADLLVYDTLGDGKVKPEIFPGNMGDKAVFQMIEMVLADFKDLGYTNEVAEGEMPGSGTAFRALAYLGSKAEESRKPQRYLWEQAHELRARKLLVMAKKVWSDDKKIKTSGNNNKFGAAEFYKSDLDGGYGLEVVQDSSRPKTLTEKMEVIQQLVGQGLVDLTDPSVRVYITDTLGVQEIDLTDNLQYAKAERDLELCKQGTQPQANPYTNWMICFKVFSDYTLTEEYESSPPEIQAGILGYTQWLHEMMSPPVPGAVPPHPGGAQQQHKQTQAQLQKGGPGGEPASHVLGQVPGAQVSNQMVQHAAETEGNAVIPRETGAN